VRVTIPPGTSSGTRMRLKGKGAAGPDGPADLYVVTRIVVPKVLDEESRRLVEEFARLNPGDPRS
jgi:DnaJ-class molecular chaperone